MILTRFYDPAIAQASFLIGCGHVGEALVIDPNRRIEQYLVEAERAGLRIVAVAETHIHADFVSGARELAARTGARLCLSDEGGTDWRYRYDAPGMVRLKHGARFAIGQIQVEVRHTPGHTPEHLSYLITDTAGAAGPVGIVTGDFVFAGDVGRPDLLERAVGVSNAAESSARTLFRSLQQFRALPDHLQVWPGHGAGSACGKGLSAMPQTTVGYEKLYNWAFAITEEDAFVRAVLEGQPEPPRYFARMKVINRDGPPVLEHRVPPRLEAESLPALLAKGETVVDLRRAAAFADGHVPGTINLPRNRSLTGWAGWLLSYDRDFFLIADDADAAGIAEVATELSMIGLDRIGGWFESGVVADWARANGPLQQGPQVTLDEVTAPAPGTLIIDLRNRNEWDAGHLPGARHIPLGLLPDHLAALNRDQPTVVHCQGGGRAAIGLSILQAAGFTRAANFAPGFAGWSAAGLPVAQG